MKIVYFNYAAVAILAMILITAAIRKVGNTRANLSFLVAVCEVLITTVFLVYAVYLDNAGPGNVTAKYIAHGGYLFFHTMTAFFYLLYLISLTDRWHILFENKGRNMLLTFPVLFFTILFIIQFFTKTKTFYINEADVYTRGPLFIINYIVGGIYLLYGILYIIQCRKLFTPQWIVTLFAPFPFIFVAMAIEFVSPKLNIEMFFNALALLFVFINIQKPEELLDSDTKLNNLLAFEDYCKKAFHNHKPMHVILVELSNYNAIKDMLDFEGIKAVRRGIADFLVDVNKTMGLKALLFYGRQGRFFAICEKDVDGRVGKAGEYIYASLKDSEQLGRISITPQVSVCIINTPEDFSDFDSFIRFCNKDTFAEDKICYVSELLKDRDYNIRLNIEKIITDAIDCGRLEVYYQPIYSFEKQRYTSAEALLRLKDPEYGFVSPEIFIPEAEKSGEINRIWDFVIKSVCEFVSGEGFEELGIEYIEVNLSAVQCVQEHLAENVLKTVDSYNIDRKKISLEITETALVYGEDMLADNLGKLHDAGMLICLDDYGTGYSNTRRIMDLPLDIVKLDKSFVEGIDTEIVQRIVRNTVSMIKAERMHIVTEGVETEAVLNELQRCGVDLIQGYYFSKPLPKDQFIEKVKE